uniref:Peptidase A1 domain-containing protein n=1 Tax=Panagrellus redivivus TaxID=6233 RepID=A0A7E4VWU8_PANRE
MTNPCVNHGITTKRANSSSNTTSLLAEQKVHLAWGLSFHFLRRLTRPMFTVIAICLMVLLKSANSIETDGPTYLATFVPPGQPYVVVKQLSQIPTALTKDFGIDDDNHLIFEKKLGYYAIATDAATNRVEFKACVLADTEITPFILSFLLLPKNTASTVLSKAARRLLFKKSSLFGTYDNDGGPVVHYPNPYGNCISFGFSNQRFFYGSRGFVVRFDAGAIVTKPLIDTEFVQTVVFVEDIYEDITLTLVYGDLIFPSTALQNDFNTLKNTTEVPTTTEEEEEPTTTEAPKTQDASVYLFIPVAVLAFLILIGTLLIIYIIFVAKIAPRIVKKRNSIQQPSTSMPLSTSKPTRRAPRKMNAPKSDYVKPLEHVLSKSDKIVVKEVSAKVYTPVPRTYHPKTPIDAKPSPKDEGPSTKKHNEGDIDSVIATVSEKKSERKYTSGTTGTPSRDETEDDNQKAVELTPTPTNED